MKIILRNNFSIFFLLAVAVILGSVFLFKNSQKGHFLEKDKNLLQNILSNDLEKTVPLRAVSFVAPHHLVARKLIENVFQKTAELNKGAEIERIILLSPNHFNIGRAPMIVADKDWNIDGGVIKSDRESLEIIRKETEIFSVDNFAFGKEHGILDLLPFVKKYFPETKVIPIIISDGVSPELAEKTANIFADNLSEKTMVILSADFSHYIGKTASEMHDRKSIEIISNLDYEKFQNLDVDCVGCLITLGKFSEKLGFKKFNLLENSNSSEIYGQDFGSENTSYITGYFSKGEIFESKSVNFLFLGDLMLDREMRTLIEKKGVDYVMEKIQRLFWSQDFNIANLEGTITDKTSISVNSKETEKRHFSFTFNPSVSEKFLKNNNINMISIGNNHSLDFGAEGLEQTKNNLKNFGIGYFGDPRDPNNFLIKEINGMKISFVNYNQFSQIGAEKVVEKIKEAELARDFTVVYAHWGMEYQLKEDEKQKISAREFIDAGADLIIGTHPHIVQPLEIYKNKAIFYSLGNFVFDQYFSEDVKTRLAVGVSNENNKTFFYLVPLYLEKNGQLSIMKGEKKQNFLEKIANDSGVDNFLKNEIIKGMFVITK